MRKISTNLTYHLQELNNDDNKVKVNRKKAIIKITGEINKTEAKKWKKFIKPRIGLLKTFKNHQTSSQDHQEEKREDTNKQDMK